MPATGYRYVDNASAKKITSLGVIAKKDGGTYVSFDKIENASTAQSKLQIPYTPDTRIGFDTLDYVNDMTIPHGNWGSANYLEPITKDYSEYGVGGATQVLIHKDIKATNIVRLSDG